MNCCAVCLEEGASYACECTAYHASCLAHVLIRSGANICKICHSKYDPEMLAAASEIAYQKTADAFGSAHGTARVRKLELASALAEIDQAAPRAKALFLEIIAAEADPKWLHAVAKIELARLEKDRFSNATRARDMLEELLPCLLRNSERWAWLERIELCTVLGSIYVQLGDWTNAETYLFLAIDSHLSNPDANYRHVVRCMGEIAKFYDARANLPLAHETRRVSLNILRCEEENLATVALAQLDLAKTEVAMGQKSLAASRYRDAIQVLHKRRSSSAIGALADARIELARIVRPSRRLRFKTLPEDC